MAFTDIRQTHTYAVLELSPAAYEEIAQKLRDAGYDHAFHEDDRHGTVVDMHGIGVCAQQDAEVTEAQPDKVAALVEKFWDMYIIPRNVDDPDLYKKHLADFIRKNL